VCECEQKEGQDCHQDGQLCLVHDDGAVGKICRLLDKIPEEHKVETGL